jgi:hypothetical protein
MSTSISGLRGRRIDLEVAVRAGATTALLASATMHSTIAAEHYGDLSRAGVIFLALQILETSLAMAVISAWSMTTAVAVWGTSLASMGLWLVSRMTGVPVAPEDVKISWLGASDVACFVLELITAAVVVPWIVRSWPRKRGSHRRGRAAQGSRGRGEDDVHRLVDPVPGGSVRQDAHADISRTVDLRRGEPHAAAPVNAP